MSDQPPKESSQRHHTVTWSDPDRCARDSAAISGLDYLWGICQGRLPQPPIARLVGYRPLAIENGRVVFELKPAEYHVNPFKTVHGGILSTLLDTAMAAAVLSTLPRGKTCTTLELKVNFVRSATPHSGSLQCRAEVIHAGRRIATVQGRIVDASDRLIAHGTSTCMIITT